MPECKWCHVPTQKPVFGGYCSVSCATQAGLNRMKGASRLCACSEHKQPPPPIRRVLPPIRRVLPSAFYATPKDRPSPLTEKVCSVCGSSFMGRWNRTICSYRCTTQKQRDASKARRTKGASQPLACAGCGKTFTFPRRKKYCCATCRPAKKNKRLVGPTERVCLVCSKPFVGRCNTALCSDECKKQRHRDIMKKYGTPKRKPRLCQSCGQVREFGSRGPVCRPCRGAPEKKQRAKCACGRGIRRDGGRECSTCRRKPSMQLPTERECPCCKKPFTSVQALYCSRGCRVLAQGRRQNARESAAVRERAAAFVPFERVCARKDCENIFPVTYFNQTQKFCCRGCSHRFQRSRGKARRLKNNPAFRVKTRISSRIRDVLRRNGLAKKNSTLKYLGCTLLQLREHLEKQFDSRMSWENYGPRGWHVDHIIPMAAFDVSKPDHVALCSHFHNLRPLWWDENEAKAADVNVALVCSAFLIRLVDAGVIEV